MKAKTTLWVQVAAAILLATLTACTYSTGRFEEPGLRAKIIDAETSLPVQGAIIYGFYATAEGSLGGGETVKEILRVFEVESNADGVFAIPPWKDNWSITRGERRQRFPAIAIYKDGYKVETQMLAAIREWLPQTLDRSPMRMDGDTLDWTARPTKLIPAKTELERYNAMINSNDAYASNIDCGWEQHVRLLWEQHKGRKAMIQQYVPTENIGSDGYIKSSSPRTQPHVEYVTRTGVDRLIERFEKSPKDWKCAKPRVVFYGDKK